MGKGQVNAKNKLALIHSETIKGVGIMPNHNSN
jgi:hypothetical protein